MKAKLLVLLKRLKNPSSIIAVVSGVILVLNNLGFVVDSDKITTIVNLVCGIGVTLGVLNDPTTPGVYIPYKEIK